MPENTDGTYTYATFRVWGGNLDARAVTKRLGIVPSESFQRGDPGGPSGTWRRGYWAITSRGQLASADLQHHIEWLLDRLEPVRAAVHALLTEEGIHADVTCYWESVADLGGPIFSAPFLQRFARMHLDLGISFFNPGT